MIAFEANVTLAIVGIGDKGALLLLAVSIAIRRFHHDLSPSRKKSDQTQTAEEINLHLSGLRGTFTHPKSGH
jgi:hypothetical protein